MIAYNESKKDKVINNVETFLAIVSEKVTKIRLLHVPKDLIDKRQKDICDQYKKLRTLPGTQKLHSIISNGDGLMTYKLYTFDTESNQFKIY